MTLGGQNRITAGLLVITFAALALLGAGAYSFDARLYGRRRLISNAKPLVPRP